MCSNSALWARCLPVVMLSMVGTFAFSAFGATYSGGSGTSGSPYVIATAQDVLDLANPANHADWDKHFRLAGDIDMSGYSGFTPIGDLYHEFTGVFQGEGHEISNLIFSSSEARVGFFGALAAPAQVSDLGLRNCTVSSDFAYYMGCLAGLNMGGTITSCYGESCVVSLTNGDYSRQVGGLVGWNDGAITGSHFFGNVAGYLYVGGLVGENRGSLTFCHAEATIDSEALIGGLVGHNNGGTVEMCSAIGVLTNGDTAGGLVCINNGSVTASYAGGFVGGSNVGGLIASNESGDVVGCFATGALNGENTCAGLIGSLQNGGVTACYAAVTVTGNAHQQGGLVAVNTQRSVLLSFWDAELSGFSRTSLGGRGLDTAQMKEVATFQAAGWGTYGWVMQPGSYPRLDWEGTGFDPIPLPGPMPLPGDGTALQPYRIHTASEFALVSKRADGLIAHFLLMNPIDCATETLYPIGDMGAFTGVFDGGGHVIRNIDILLENDEVGVFSTLDGGGELRNLVLENVRISGRQLVGGLVARIRSGSVNFCRVSGLVTGDSHVGGLAGHNLGTIHGCHALGAVSGNGNVGGLVGSNSSQVTACSATSTVTGGYSSTGGLIGSNFGPVADCHASGHVSGQDKVGGLLGESYGNPITSCHAEGVVVGNGERIGGLIGECVDTTITLCYAMCDVEGNSHVGGLVGRTQSYHGGGKAWDENALNSCFATGEVFGETQYVGGLVGGNYGANINYCFALGAVTGEVNVGGLVGFNGEYELAWGTIHHCYAAGAVQGLGETGGLVGHSMGGMIEDSFFDLLTGGPVNGLGTGLPTSQMKQRATFEGVGWEFASPAPVWYIIEDLSYPQLVGIPMPVGSIAALQSMALFPNGVFFLYRDIDARETAGWIESSSVRGFLPVGTEAAPFTGRLDGRGFSISGLHIHRPSLDHVGLFGYIGPGGSVGELGLSEANITGGNHIGGLAGANFGNVSRCYVQGKVEGIQEVGGLIGVNGGVVSECYAAGAVEGVSPGGLIGADEGGSVSASFWDDTLSGIFDSAGGEGLTTEAMQTYGVYADAGWDMTWTWLINEGLSYPYFRNGTPVRVVAGPPRFVNADTVDILLETYVAGVFVTGGGGSYPAWLRMNDMGLAFLRVPLKREAVNRLTLSVVSETGHESVFARFRVYNSENLPVSTEISSLHVYPDHVALDAGAAQSFLCVATFADGTASDISAVVAWNAGSGLITSGGYYVHSGNDSTVQAVFHTDEGWRYSNVATVTTAKSDRVKSGTGLVSGVIRSHYTGLGLQTARVTAYNVALPGVSAQHNVYDSLGNFGFSLQENIYHFEGLNTGFRSETFIGGILLESPIQTSPGVWSQAYYSGQVKSGRPLQYSFDLRPNDAQAPWVYFVDPPESRTVNSERLVVTAINADKYSKLAVATFELNQQTSDILGQISSTGFYRNTWTLAQGANVLHLYSVDTEGNAAERTVQIVYDPDHDPSGYTPPAPDGPSPEACTRVKIVSPRDGASVRGNAVTLLAEAIEGDLGDVDAVSFELRGPGTDGAWVSIDTAFLAPHSVTWNTNAHGSGTYELRAAAISLDGCVDDAPETVSLTISVTASHFERVESGAHLLSAPVPAGSDTVLALLDGDRFARIFLPANALGASDVLTAFFPNAGGFTPALTAYQQDAGRYLNVSLANHTGDFLNNKRARLDLGYPDENEDGELDDSGLSVSQLVLKHLPGSTSAFTSIASSSLAQARRCVVGETRHFSVFGIIAQQPAPPLNILTEDLANGVKDASYTVSLEANGGVSPYTWSVISGTLPSGMAIDGNTITGTPSATGLSSFTLQVADAQEQAYTASGEFSLTVFDAAQPDVTITRVTGQPSVANNLPVSWDIAFSEAVSGFDVNDIVMTGTAKLNASYTVTNSGDNLNYTLDVTSLPYDGTLRPRVPAGAATTGTLESRASTGEEAVWVDRKAPLAQIACVYSGTFGIAGDIVHDALPVYFRIGFEESVSGFDNSDISFVETIPGLAFGVSGSGKEYTLRISHISNSYASSITPVLRVNAVQDAAGNGNAQTTYSGRTVKYVPDLRPTVTINQGAAQSDPTNTLPVLFDIVFSQNVTGFTQGDLVYVTGTGSAPNPSYSLSGSGSSYTLTVSNADGDGRIAFYVPEDVVNGGNRASTSNDNVVTLDRTPPSITLGAPSSLTTRQGPVAIPVYYNGATAISLNAADIMLDRTDTAQAQVVVTGTGVLRRVVILSGISGSGSVAVRVAPDTAVDAVGNSALAAGPSQTILVGAPKADFYATPTSGAAPLEVRFIDNSQPGAAPVDNWHWTFGDGAESVEAAPIHTYEDPGVYAVSLTVSTAVGVDVKTRTGYIQVSSGVPIGGALPLALLVLALSLWLLRRPGKTEKNGVSIKGYARRP